MNNTLNLNDAPNYTSMIGPVLIAAFTGLWKLSPEERQSVQEVVDLASAASANVALLQQQNPIDPSKMGAAVLALEGAINNLHIALEKVLAAGNMSVPDIERLRTMILDPFNKVMSENRSKLDALLVCGSSGPQD